MALSRETKEKTGNTHLPQRDDLSSAIGANITGVAPVEFSKAEKELLRSNALTVEDNDPFNSYYDASKDNPLVKPTIEPGLLVHYCYHNNTLLQCVAAMEVNIDGTGYELEPRDEKQEEQGGLDEEAPNSTGEQQDPESDDDLELETDPIEQAKKKAKKLQQEQAVLDAKKVEEEKLQAEEDAAKKEITDFLDEPYPGVSFLSLRRAVRRDLESAGNGYMEVIRNRKGEIVFYKHLDAKLIRLVRLDDPITVKKEVVRFGKKSDALVNEHQRRFAMMVGTKTSISNVTKIVYFKEFGVERHLDKYTGKWEATPETRESKTTQAQVAPANRATEIIHYTCVPDVNTLYGLPRWINNSPSVLGSRKAEELNLEFFNSGGLPPAMILIQGGSLSPESRKALTTYLSGAAQHKQRGIIAELFSSSGDLSKSSNVSVTVERFGAERQQDAMFMKYDDQTSEHVRTAFRLPSLFLGKNSDYTYATAYVSYMVAEAQVFRPERDEFDDLFNMTVMKEIAPDWKVRSKPISFSDVESQLKALELTKDTADKQSWLDDLNESTHLNLELPEESNSDPMEDLEEKLSTMMQPGLPAGVQPVAQQVQVDPNGEIEKMDDDILSDLVDDWSAWVAGEREFSDTAVDAMRQLIGTLAPPIRKMFNGYVSMKLLPGEHRDPDGTAELLACATDHIG